MATHTKRELLILLCLLLFTILVRLPSLQQPFENDSSAIAYHARLITRGEPLYTTHHPAHHVPGTYYTYALAFASFGDAVQSVKALLILWTAATAYLVYRLGRLVQNRYVGLLAGVSFILLSAHLLLAGTNSKIESWVILPQVATILSVLALRRQQHAPWAFFLVGLFMALTFWFKVNYLLSPTAVVGLALIADLWPQRRSNMAWRQAIARGLWIMAGVGLGVAPVLVYFVSLGAGPGLLTAFKLGLGYTSVQRPDLQSPIYLVLYPLLILARANLVLLISALVGLVIVARENVVQWRRRPRPGTPLPINYIALWFVLCFVETGVSRTYLHNYYLVFLAPVSLLAAWLVTRIATGLSSSGSVCRPQVMAVATGGWLLLVGLAMLPDHAPYYYHYYAGYVPGRESHDEFLVNGLPEGVGETMLAMRELAAYLDARTTPDDTLYYWSSLMQLYYMADRRSASKIIWPIYAGALAPREQIFTATYFLVGNVPLGYTENPTWLYEGLAANYYLENTLYGQQVYRHK